MAIATTASAHDAESIATNAENIATNAGNIATNAAGVMTNAEAIATNTGNIATNAGNIATNAGGIAENMSAIGANAGAIAANSNSIGANASASSRNSSMIGELSDDLDYQRNAVEQNSVKIGNLESQTGTGTHTHSSGGAIIGGSGTCEDEGRNRIACLPYPFYVGTGNSLVNWVIPQYEQPGSPAHDLLDDRYAPDGVGVCGAARIYFYHTYYEGWYYQQVFATSVGSGGERGIYCAGGLYIESQFTNIGIDHGNADALWLVHESGLSFLAKSVAPPSATEVSGQGTLAPQAPHPQQIEYLPWDTGGYTTITHP